MSNVSVNANPWTVREAGKASVPPNNYTGRFVGVESITNAKWEGERWRWTWEVTTGQHTGNKADALTQCDISPNTQAGRIVAGLLGRAIQTGEDVQAAINACVGKVYLVSVMPGPQGGKPAVRSVLPNPM
jgi:hypothetical protein